jgi:hypothetical protein
LATPNESGFEIYSSNDAWFASLKARLVQFFETRATPYEGLHKSGIYDVFLIFLGFPASVWITINSEHIVEKLGAQNNMARALVYGYFLFFSITLFRFLFSYGRWLFPKIKLNEASPSSLNAHRALWGIIISAIIIPIFYDIIKSTFGLFK